mmetsp:Transcript_24029/g.83385  ORF Transcript_24029/g.83385 Transcript_24029/m.83385 type:complete len:280 (+) Transcript_24029:1954-2793(+)
MAMWPQPLPHLQHALLVERAPYALVPPQTMRPLAQPFAAAQLHVSSHRFTRHRHGLLSNASFRRRPQAERIVDPLGRQVPKVRLVAPVLNPRFDERAIDAVPELLLDQADDLAVTGLDLQSIRAAPVPHGPMCQLVNGEDLDARRHKPLSVVPGSCVEDAVRHRAVPAALRCLPNTLHSAPKTVVFPDPAPDVTRTSWGDVAPTSHSAVVSTTASCSSERSRRTLRAAGLARASDGVISPAPPSSMARVPPTSGARPVIINATRCRSHARPPVGAPAPA